MRSSEQAWAVGGGLMGIRGKGWLRDGRTGDGAASDSRFPTRVKRKTDTN